MASVGSSVTLRFICMAIAKRVYFLSLSNVVALATPFTLYLVVTFLLLLSPAGITQGLVGPFTFRARFTCLVNTYSAVLLVLLSFFLTE